MSECRSSTILSSGYSIPRLFDLSDDESDDEHALRGGYTRPRYEDFFDLVGGRIVGIAPASSLGEPSRPLSPFQEQATG